MSVRSILDFFNRPRMRWLRQTREENCVQTVVAIVLGLPIDAVEQEAGTAGRLNVMETLSLLSRLGVYCRPVSARLAASFWPVFYRTNGGRNLRGLGFQLPKDGERVGHAYVIAGSRMYDPATGRFTRVDESTLATLDWIAIFPEDVHANPRLSGLKAAMTTAV